MLRTIAGGWRLSPIITAQTGNFVTPSTGTDTALNGQPTEWINPAAFGPPALGTYGNLGAGTILAPGSLAVNLALSRLFQIREGQTLEVRVHIRRIHNQHFGHRGRPSNLAIRIKVLLLTGFQHVQYCDRAP